MLNYIILQIEQSSLCDGTALYEMTLQHVQLCYLYIVLHKNTFYICMECVDMHIFIVHMIIKMLHTVLTLNF